MIENQCFPKHKLLLLGQFLTMDNISPNHSCIDWSRVNCVIFYYRRFDWKILCILDWIRVYAEKLVNATKSHKIVYAPMHRIRVITRLAKNGHRTDLASASSRLCLSYTSTTHWLRSPASIVLIAK